ncbi:hypothetical protein Glove_118g4 [Diversispora epigaea]|uniref:RING-type domain-containing protein n=1 Tax=Diversispora epigaea TaxID=1348612 RepID=A0A397IZW3_9GLOM|nr:hypothetical protein Glove_118g4 [Diversispora epigaea]
MERNIKRSTNTKLHNDTPIMIDEIGLHINLIYLRLKAVESELRDKKAKCKRELLEFETDNSDTSDSNCSNILPDVVTVKKIHESKNLGSIHSKPKKKRNKNKQLYENIRKYVKVRSSRTYLFYVGIMLRTEKVLTTNLKNLAYSILKTFNDDVIKNKKFSELPNCVECDKKIFSTPNKVFTSLVCGHVFHRICIEKKLLLTKPNGCLFPDCGKSVETITEATTTETDLRRDSESSTSSVVGKMKKQLNIQSQEIIDEEMLDVGIDMTEGSNKRPIEVSSEKITMASEKSHSKKAKKEVKPVDRKKSANLKKLIDELLSNYIHPQIDEVVEESIQEVGSINFLYLFKKIDYTKSRNEITNQEYKKDNGKEASNALVFGDVSKQIPKMSDTAL